MGYIHVNMSPFYHCKYYLMWSTRDYLGVISNQTRMFMQGMVSLFPKKRTYADYAFNTLTTFDIFNCITFHYLMIPPLHLI